MSRPRYLPFLLIILTSGLLLQCAKVGAPPGGPIDKTSPKILFTNPSKDSINVARSNQISIEFSESIDKKSLDGAIFITPRFSDDLEWRWEKKNLTIMLPDSFAPNTTYIVNIGASVTDLRRNKMENSYIFAFSTGETLSRGRIAGRIYRNDKPAAGITVGLYNFILPDSTTPLDSIYPPYMTQSGKEGEYVLEYIPDGEYFLLAFEDKNKNQFFNYPKEAYGISDRPTIVVQESESSALDFYLAKDDTTKIDIMSVTVTGDQLVKVRLTGNILSDTLINNRLHIRLVPVDETKAELSAVAILESSGEQFSTFHINFGPLEETTYRLIIDSGLVTRPGDSLSYVKSGEFSYTAGADNKPPQLISMSHKNKTIFLSDSLINFRFSEMINFEKISHGGFELFDSDSVRLDFDLKQPDDFSIELIGKNLSWDNKYTILLMDSLLLDMSGNRMSDSVRYFKFSTYNSDSLGSVSGRVIIEPPLDSTSEALIKFSAVRGKFSREEVITTGEFNLSLPPGKYILRGFLDRNGNGRFDGGRLTPFHYSETAAQFPDTVRVRARFETADLELRFK